MGFRFEKLSVLVVEDTGPMRKLICSVLDTLGVGRTVTANDGNHGFTMFCNERPDIVITDWHMEPVNGIELVQKIRTSPASPNKFVPVIMVTGYSAVPRVAQARDTGATEFLVKPFSANDLAKRIAHVINKPRDFIEAYDYFGPDRRRRKPDDYRGPLRREDDQDS
ncbi:MAG: response regulator [Alphaproteobacteria bacterium]|nr:response regulator [Alphaproteobacteria bacterium]